MDRIPNSWQRRTLWSAITGLAIFVIAALAVTLVWITGEVINFLSPVLIPVAIAGIIAYLLEPVVRAIVSKGVRRSYAVSMVFVGFLCLATLIAVSVGPVSYRQAEKLIDQREAIGDRISESFMGFMESYEDTPLLNWFTPSEDDDGNIVPSDAEVWLREHASEVAEQIFAFLVSGLRGAIAFFGMLIGLLLVPLYVWFFLLKGPAIQQNWDRYIPLRASRFRTEFVDCLREINQYLISFFRGQMIVSLIDGILVATALFLFGLPYALLIGLFVAILGLIPFLGNILCWIPAVLISIAHFSIPENQHEWLGPLGEHIWTYPIAVTILFFTVQQINGFITAPKIVGDSVGLHPMTVIFSIFFWTLLLGGLLGALLAVPLTASVKVLFKRYIWARRLQQEPSHDPSN